jgi:hypothetical protein
LVDVPLRSGVIARAGIGGKHVHELRREGVKDPDTPYGKGKERRCKRSPER